MTTRQRQVQVDIAAEVDLLTNWLGSHAGGQRNGFAPLKTTVPAKVYRALRLHHDGGWILYNGAMLDIKGKGVGAGLYEVWTEGRSRS